MRIQRRLIFYYLAVVAVAVLAMGIFFIWFFEFFYMKNLEQNLYGKTRITSELVREMLIRNASAEEIDSFCVETGKDLNIRFTVVDPEGIVLGDAMEDPFLMENHAERPEFTDSLKYGFGSSIRYSDTLEQDMFYVAVPVCAGSSVSPGRENSDKELLGFVRTALPLSEIRAVILRLQVFTGVALLLSAFAAAVTGIILSRRITGPVSQISDAAESIASGNYEPPLQIEGKDELAALAGTIKEMGKSLQNNLHRIMLEKNKLETVISSINSGIILFNNNLFIEIMNPAAEKMFDIDMEKTHGLPASAFLRYQNLTENIETVRREGKFFGFELNIFYPQAITVLTSLIPVKSNSHEVMGILAIFHDITDLRSLEKMRSEFAANVSHELRTPITTIKGYTETLLELNLKDHEKTEEFLGIIARETNRLSVLIESLLDLSNIEEHKGIIKKQLVDIIALAEESIKVINDAAAVKEITVKTEFDKEKILVQGNPDWLKQAVLNILENAVNYGFQGGEVFVRITVKDDNAELAVQDNGPGIPAADLPHIFERFYRVDKARSRKYGGTGLGLSIVKHILDAHDASYTVESTEGRGTVFRFALPVKDIVQ